MFYDRTPLKRHLSFYLVWGLLPLLAAIILTVTLCFFVNEGNYAWIVTIDGFCGTLAIFFFLTVLYTKIIPFCKEKTFLAHLEKGTKEKIDGVIAGISTTAIHRRGLPFAEITIETGGNERIFYYALISTPFPFSKNDEVELLTVGNYIYDGRKANHGRDE